MIEAELEGFIYIGGGSHALLQHVKGFIADHGIDAAGDEAGRLLDDHYFFSHAAANFGAGGQGGVVGFQGTNNFQQFHLVHRIEKVHAQPAAGAIGHGSNLGDAERRSVGSENGMRPADLIEQSEDFDLRFDFFRYSFDDQIGHARRLFHRAGVFNSAKGGF